MFPRQLAIMQTGSSALAKKQFRQIYAAANRKSVDAISITCFPITSEAVAAGDGTLQT
jgi:hypothetical protein